MSSAICLKMDQSKILLSGKGLKFSVTIVLQAHQNWSHLQMSNVSWLMKFTSENIVVISYFSFSHSFQHTYILSKYKTWGSLEKSFPTEILHNRIHENSNWPICMEKYPWLSDLYKYPSEAILS